MSTDAFLDMKFSALLLLSDFLISFPFIFINLSLMFLGVTLLNVCYENAEIFYDSPFSG